MLRSQSSLGSVVAVTIYCILNCDQVDCGSITLKGESGWTTTFKDFSRFSR